MNEELMKKLKALLGQRTPADATRAAMPRMPMGMKAQRGYEATPVNLAAERIAGEEKFSATPYLDEGGVPTIGYGHTGKDITMQSAPWTESQAMDSVLARVRSDSARTVKDGFPLNEVLLAAAHNLGYGGLRKTGALREAKAGNWAAAADSLASAYNVNGKPSKGLIKRRERDRADLMKMLTAEPMQKLRLPGDR